MSQSSSARGQGQSPLAALRRLVRPRATAERCEMCSASLAADHQHLIEMSSRQLACACDACAILFSGQVEKRYKRIPRRIRYLSDFRITDVQWESLMLPINLAFFFKSTPEGRTVALYPSPAGPVESLLALDAWNEIVQDNAILEAIEPDVEALLVNRVSVAREYYLVPVDECYKLVGLIRTHWQGLSGGAEAWAEIGRFFKELKDKAVRGQ